ncbi:nmrA-like family protein [Sarocladium implicatum]|nr:nmrA-like family protein [Sarocladium implicatum]
MAQNVLVLGAGELGLALLESLTKHPEKHNTKLSVLLRPGSINSTAPEKVKEIEHLRSLGVALQPGDVVGSSISELAHIFKSYDTIVSCNGMALPSGTQLKLSDAVLEAGVKRYFPWQFGMDYDIIGQGSSQDLFDEQLAVRRKLRAQSVTEWTIVSTGLFMTFLFLPAFGVVDIENRTVRALGSWDNEITVTLPRDIGRITADLVLVPAGVANEVVFTAGDTASYARIAELVKERFADVGEFKTEVWDLETLRKQVEDDAPLAKYRATFGEGRGVAWGTNETVNVKRGIEVTGIKEYLKEL